MTMEEFILSPSFLSTIVGGAITAVISLQLWFLKWFVQSFEKLATAIKDQGNRMQQWLMDHENKDQLRHIDNLQRFEDINVQLAKLEP